MVQLISEFFAHVEVRDIPCVGVRSVMTRLVFILDEAIFVDAVFDPISVLLFAFYECVKFTSVAKLNGWFGSPLKQELSLSVSLWWL